MTGTDNETMLRQSRAAWRLIRLFKIERDGGFARRPPSTVRRLVERRGGLVEELLRLDAVRRALACPRSAELDQALGELGREVDRAMNVAREMVEQLGGDLRMRQGGGAATGIRDGAKGRLLGKT